MINGSLGFPAHLSPGNLAESMGEFDRAFASFESALRCNPMSVPAMKQLAGFYKNREQYPKVRYSPFCAKLTGNLLHQAVEAYQKILSIDNKNGDIWCALGHLHLMMDDLPKAYSAYQQALVTLPNPKEARIWYGIGILYDRNNSLEQAEEAFSNVLQFDPAFEKTHEIYFRLGLIRKKLGKFEASLQVRF